MGGGPPGPRVRVQGVPAHSPQRGNGGRGWAASVVEGEAAAQQLVRHDASRPHVAGWRELAAQRLCGMGWVAGWGGGGRLRDGARVGGFEGPTTRALCTGPSTRCGCSSGRCARREGLRPGGGRNGSGRPRAGRPRLKAVAGVKPYKPSYRTPGLGVGSGLGWKPIPRVLGQGGPS